MANQKYTRANYLRKPIKYYDGQCQLDRIWSHLRDKTLGLSVREFLNSASYSGRASLNGGNTVLLPGVWDGKTE